MTRISDMTSLAALPATLAYVPVVYGGVNYKFDLASAIDVGLDAQLTSVASLSYTGNALKAMRVNAGETAFELATITSFAWTVLDDANAAAACTTLGVGTGDSPQFTAVNIGHATDTTITRVSAGVIAVEGVTLLTTATGQPLDAELSAIAGLTSAADKGIQFTGAGTAATYDLTAAGKALLDDASAAAQATTLGLGTGDSPQFTAINLGHASDTTITRSAAGKIAVEGNVLTSGGNLIGVRTITTTGAGTYTPTAGTNSIVVEAVAGGGSGGGADAVAGQVAMSQSGSGGGYFRVRLTANFSGAAYSVGAGGTAPAAGNNAGNNGGDTTFTDTAGSPTIYGAGGGNGGGAGVSSASASFYGPLGGSGSGSGGDVRVRGGAAGPSHRLGASLGYTGNGGDSMLGSGGRGSTTFGGNTSQAGQDGAGYGSGGSGGICEGTAAAVAGGAGANGAIIIWEYS